MGGDTDTNKTETVDYSKFDPKFTNQVETIAPEWGELYARRAEYLAKNRHNLNLTPEIPDDIVGLVPIKGRTPITMKWYRRTTSFERNGFFNIQTPVFNTKYLQWSFPIFLLWGWIQMQVTETNREYYDDNGDNNNQLYWKLQDSRVPNASKWMIPG